MQNNAPSCSINSPELTVHRVTAFLGEQRTRTWVGTSPKVLSDGSLSIVDVGTGQPVLICGSYTLEAALNAHAA